MEIYFWLGVLTIFIFIFGLIGSCLKGSSKHNQDPSYLTNNSIN